MRDYNEFLVKEWSGEANPVAALFYVVSDSGDNVTPAGQYEPRLRHGAHSETRALVA